MKAVTLIPNKFFFWFYYNVLMSHQWYDKWFFEAQSASDGEDRVKTGEHGGKEDDLPYTRVHWEVG